MAKKNRKKFGSFEVPDLRNASKTLFANIRFASLDEEVKTIVVTSTVMDEGKSTVVSNLACAIASSGKKVLIVDADMRRRSLGAMLGLHGANGIYSVLSGKVALGDAIVATDFKNLYFLDAEPNIPSPPDVLSTKRFAALVKTLRSSFDYVIFDTPPVGLFPDAAIVSNLVDGALLVVRQHSTDRKDALNAVSQLNAADARILGTVMTFVPSEDSDYYYYAYYNEEGKRVGRSHSSESEILDDDISAWADNAGVDFGDKPRRGARAASVPKVDTREDAASKPENPYAPGSYRTSSPAATSPIGRHSQRHS